MEFQETELQVNRRIAPLNIRAVWVQVWLDEDDGFTTAIEPVLGMVTYDLITYTSARPLPEGVTHQGMLKLGWKVWSRIPRYEWLVEDSGRIQGWDEDILKYDYATPCHHRVFLAPWPADEDHDRLEAQIDELKSRHHVKEAQVAAY